MFCYKCGCKLPDDSAFCHICGCKTASIASSQDNPTPQQPSIPQQPSVTQVQSNTYQEYNLIRDTTAKKKSKKVPIIIGTVSLLLIMFIFMGNFGNDNSTPSVNLPQIYTNKEAGYTFNYPEDWNVTENIDLANYYKEMDGEHELTGFLDKVDKSLQRVACIEIVKHQADEETVKDMLATNISYFNANYFDESADCDDIQRSGIPVRMARYTINDYYYQSYYYKSGSYMYEVNFSCESKIKKDMKSCFNAIMKSFTITSGDVNNEGTFSRMAYFTGITQKDLLRYANKYMDSRVYFSAMTVVDILETQKYVVKSNNIFLSEYFVIDNKRGSISAAVGDKITVYGTFKGNTTVTFIFGNSEQAPIISANKFIVNNVIPDKDELAKALVAHLNNSPYTFGNDGKYISDSTVQLVLGVYSSGKSTDITIFNEDKFTWKSTHIGDIDGYSVYISPKLSPGLVSPKDAGVKLDENLISPVRTKVTITSIEQNPFNKSIITIGFLIEEFEPY